MDKFRVRQYLAERGLAELFPKLWADRRMSQKGCLNFIFTEGAKASGHQENCRRAAE